MSFQRYPLSTVQKVSQCIRSGLELPALEAESNPSVIEDDTIIPASLDDLGDLFRVGDAPEDALPAPNREGRWYLSTKDPGDSLNRLPGLWLKAGIRLVTYLQCQADGGTGITWAMPELLSTTEYLEEAIEKASDNSPPHPVGALPNVMNGLEGDGSLSSFLAASIFLREIREFGRFGRQSRWIHHRFVAEVPGKVAWQWKAKSPQDFSTKVVTLPDGQVVVEFFSCRVQRPIALFRHVDRYSSNSYHPNNADQVLAVTSK
jgi:hypothetical protein